jgi:ABC-type branched-subunit amino acid transport system substrate-binding protein
MIRRVPAFPTGRYRPGAGSARAVLFGVAAALSLGGCAPIGFQGTPPAHEAPPIPSVEEGSLPAPSAREGARLLGEARAFLSAGAYEEARSAAEGVIRHYPGAPGSGEALEILARSALGLELPGEAVEPAGRYAGLLGSSHSLFPAAVLLWSQALAAAGDPGAAAETLLLLPPGSPPAVAGPARELFREGIGGMDAGSLLEAGREVAASHPLRGTLLTELAVALHFSGDGEGALRWAREALAGPLDPGEEELARAILDGRLEEALGRPLILGVILPRSGVSPSLLEYATSLEEGIQVAVEESKGELRRSVRIEVEDDRGLPGGGRASIRRLEELGALGAIGPLMPEALLEAVAGRQTAIPIISPTALPASEMAPGVFALSGPDMDGARALARFAHSVGLRRIAVMRPPSDAARQEAAVFREELDALGITLAREVVFEPGATFFRDELTQVASSRPDGLFLPLPPDEIELLAPQLSYFGLDTLGIQLLGTSGWTSDDVLSRVDPRHTDGVVASTSRLGAEDMEAFERFRAAYERTHRKTLRSPVPAFGYDAASLLLRAFQSQPRSPSELTRALDRIRDFPGATGRLSVENGRIIRTPRLARIQDRELVPIQGRFN